jgi:hypothetical protein
MARLLQIKTDSLIAICDCFIGESSQWPTVAWNSCLLISDRLCHPSFWVGARVRFPQIAWALCPLLSWGKGKSNKVKLAHYKKRNPRLSEESPCFVFSLLEPVTHFFAERENWTFKHQNTSRNCLEAV